MEYPVRRNVELLLEHFRPLAPIAWVPSDNFHITTKFIGAWSEDRLGELKEALRGIERTGEIGLRIQGFGWFPNPHQPRALFAGAKTTEALTGLVMKLREACARLGLASEDRAYTPHLTLGKIKQQGGERVNLTPLRQAIAQLPSDDFGISKASKLLLYKSEGGVYTVIEEFVL